MGQRDEALHALGHDADVAWLAPREIFGLATVYFYAGDLGAARRWSTLLLERSTRRDLPLLSGWAHNLLGRVAYEVNALDEAQAQFTAVVAERQRFNFPIVAEALLGLALTEQARGQSGRSEWLLSELDELLVETGNDESRPIVLASQARLALQRGDRAEANRWLDTRGAAAEAILPMMEVPSMTHARLLLARGATGDAAAAIELLTATQARAEREHVVGGVIQALAVRAVAEQAQGTMDTALDYLADALDLAEPGGFIRTFLDLGAPMQALLRAVTARRPPSPYLDRLLTAESAVAAPLTAPSSRTPAHLVDGERQADPPAATRLVLPGAPAPAQRDPVLVLVETLTEREVQVLEQLGRHLTNKEIAAELSISPLTVKRHVSNLCGKLGAGTRRQAVVIATALGLIPHRSPW
jgi:LuxR family maltose regulon positive regulatory protein